MLNRRSLEPHSLNCFFEEEHVDLVAFCLLMVKKQYHLKHPKGLIHLVDQEDHYFQLELFQPKMYLSFSLTGKPQNCHYIPKQRICGTNLKKSALDIGLIILRPIRPTERQHNLLSIHYAFLLPL